MKHSALDALCCSAGEGRWRYSPAQHTDSELPEAQRLYTLAADEIEQPAEAMFQHVAEVQTVAPKTSGRPGDIEISRFLRLLDLVHEVPWACLNFDENHKIILQLTASHLELLVDRSVARAHGPRLRGLIGQHTRDSNLVWITNRQQGKTTSLAKFLACLSVASSRGGNLVGIYRWGAVPPPHCPRRPGSDPVPAAAHRSIAPKRSCGRPRPSSSGC